jgi:hypothetical protein
MCWACQEGDRERIWSLIDIISTGRCRPAIRRGPARHGLPQPGELYREEQPDGTILIRQVAPSELAKKKTEPKNNFVVTVRTRMTRKVDRFSDKDHA